MDKEKDMYCITTKDIERMVDFVRREDVYGTQKVRLLLKAIKAQKKARKRQSEV